MTRFSVLRSPSLSSILNWFRNSRAKRGPSRPGFIISEPEPLDTEDQERALRLEEEVGGFARSQLQSSLLRLPREIRDQIWQECLDTLEIWLDLALQGRYRQVRTFRSKGLLSVPLSCRQM